MPRASIAFQWTFLFLWAAMSLTSCVEKEFDPNDAKKSFGIAKEPFDEKHYEDAIKRLGEFKSRFPYSQFAAEAEILIADSHFQLEHFQEAASAYETFVKLHPKHNKVDYASYRVAESYWEDSPESPSREQEYCEKARGREKISNDQLCSSSQRNDCKGSTTSC
jgi:outer membrane protein assembly factor BamD